MKIKLLMLSAFALAMIQSGTLAIAQQSAPQSSQTPASPASPAAPPLHMNTIGPPAKIEFPPTNPKNFTAASPTPQEVNSFLKQIWGYDPNRVWEVVGVQTTPVSGLNRVTILVGEQGVSHTPSPTVFFVTPDGNHAIAGTDVITFGAHPFAAVQEKLETRATGPYRGASSKNLMLVEFADLQCPDCKLAAPTMDKLATDFPNARIVFQIFPLTSIHPEAEKAAEYAVCVAQQKGNAAFFQFVQAVFDTQENLKTDADGTLKAAATKAGADATAVSTCAATSAAAGAVAASVKLGKDLDVNETPTLFVNGRPVPVTGVPYNTLKQIIA
ncbi:MAG TPA: thioredoxin domain-containing protein, partial [Acidobacteriaceae bacterium]|nr:thioredoxin domain-containing protein [Acidobacteriaceae bacterium]